MTFTKVVADDILSLSASEDTIPADGVTRVELVAQFQNDGLTTNQRKITFTTTAGTLEGSNGEGEVSRMADESGKASVFLTSSVRGGEVAVVSATGAGVVQTAQVTFEEVTPDDVLTLVPDTNTIPADGITRVKLVATLKKEPKTPEQRMISFSTTAGTLVGSTSGEPVVRMVDANNEAFVFLASGNRVGEVAVVSATGLGVVQTAQVEFTEVDPDAVLILTKDRQFLEADGVSFVTYEAQLGPSASPESTQVTFKVSDGNFVSAGERGASITVNTDPSRVARARLVSTTSSGIVHVEAVVAQTVRRDTIRYESVIPDFIEVEADAFALVADSTFGSGSETRVTATLRRNNGGLASVGTPIRFIATVDGNQVVPGFDSVEDGFRNQQTSDSAGMATAEFSVGKARFTGTLTIRVELVDNPSIFGIAQIEVIPPAN